MKNFRAADKTHAGGDEKHDINFHWPYNKANYKGNTSNLHCEIRACGSV
jgi:hypothetical protein